MLVSRFLLFPGLLSSIMFQLHKFLNVDNLQKLGGSGDLSPEAVKRCAEELHFDEESGELRQEALRVE